MRDIDVLNHLVTDPAITAIIADRIWTTWLPEKTKMPALSCNFTADAAINTLSGDTLKTRQTISINCWTKDKKTLNDLVSAVMLKMMGFGYRVGLTELNEQEQGIYRYSIDYSIFG